MMKYLFRYKDEGSAPNLSDKVELIADRGYWGRDMLRYLLSKGADLLGTVKRLNWYPFTWGKKGSATSAKSSDRPESIPLDGQPRWYQSTAKHNFGKSSTKDHQLTVTAYRNGYCKSAIGMTLSSDPQYDNTVDLSISSAKHAKIYLNKDQSKTERCMSAYSLVAGSDPCDSADDEEVECRTPHCDVFRQLRVMPITMLQGDQSWFLMRCFALTSSIMDRIIRAKSPYVYVSDELRSSFETVLEYAGLTRLLPNDDADAGLTDDDGMDMEDEEGEESLSSHITIGDETVEEVLNDELIPRDVEEASDAEEGYTAYKYGYKLPSQM